MDEHTAQTTPEEEAPLDLDAIMRDQRTLRTQPAEETGPDAHEEETKPADEPALLEEDHPDFGSEDRREEEDTPPPPEDEPEEDFRFKSHQEAEKGYRNLQGKLTRIEQKLAEIENGEQTRRKQEAEQAKAKSAAEAQAKLKDFSVDRYSKMHESIDALDPDSPDYRKKVADIQTQAYLDIRDFERGMDAPPTQPETAAETGMEPPPPDEPDVSAKRIVDKALKAADIKPDDPVFAHYARYVPTQDTDGRPLTLDEQVTKAIEWTQKYHASQKKRYRQQTEQPLDRPGPGKNAGDKGPKDPRDTENFSLSDALEAAEKRRMIGR